MTGCDPVGVGSIPTVGAIIWAVRSTDRISVYETEDAGPIPAQPTTMTIGRIMLYEIIYSC